MKTYNKKLSTSSLAMVMAVALAALPLSTFAEGIDLGTHTQAQVNVTADVVHHGSDNGDGNGNGGQDQNGAKDNEQNDNETGSRGSVSATSSVDVDASTTADVEGDHLPPGILHAPGIQNRIDEGKGLPSGFSKFFEGFFSAFGHRKDNATSTNATSSTSTMNVVLHVSDTAVRVGTSTASVGVKTNEQTTVTVEYSTSSPVTASSSVASDSSLSTDHKMTLSGLTPGTKYYFVAVAKDAQGNVKATEESSFTTKTTDVTAPTILFSTAFNVGASSAQLIWVTNERSDSRVWVGTSTPVVVTGTSTVSASGLAYFHSLEVSGLATSTQYYYAIESTDASGNTSTSATGSFTTAAH